MTVWGRGAWEKSRMVSLGAARPGAETRTQCGQNRAPPRRHAPSPAKIAPRPRDTPPFQSVEKCWVFNILKIENLPERHAPSPAKIAPRPRDTHRVWPKSRPAQETRTMLRKVAVPPRSHVRSLERVMRQPGGPIRVWKGSGKNPDRVHPTERVWKESGKSPPPAKESGKSPETVRPR